MSQKTVLSLGEIVWDVFPEERKLGGAPLNFAYYASQNGAHSYIISALGNDCLGDETMEIIRGTGVDYSLIQRNERPTGQVIVTLSGDGIPQYEIKEGASWDYIESNPEIIKLAATADAVCWGALAQRNGCSRNAIFNILDATSEKCLKIFDINIRQHYYSREIVEGSLQRANILKLNEDELPLIAEMFGTDNENAIQTLSEKYSLKMVLFTQGAVCSEVYVDGCLASHIDTPKVKVADTVGAGDSFTSAFVSNLLGGKTVQQAHAAAVRTSAYVCTCKGAINPLPENI